MAVTVAVVAAMLVAVGASPARALSVDVSPIGNAPTLPSQASVQGATAASTPLQLTFVLRPTNPQGLAQLAESVSTPGSADYRHYLAPGEFAQRFGASLLTVNALRAVLSARGLSPGPVSPNRLAIPVSTTAGQAASALGVQLHNVRLAGGRVAYANTNAPQLPTTVAGALSSIVGLDSLAPSRPLWATQPSTSAAPVTTVASGPQPCAAATAGETRYGGYTANQIAAAYSFGGLYANGDLGTGQTVALFELANYDGADIATFASCYGATGQVSNIAVDGGATSNNGAIEAELDIEGVLDVAPKANISVYAGPNTGAGTYDTFSRIVNDDTAQVISTSWGDCEAFSTNSIQPENVLFQQAAVQGQTVVASSGDNGSEDCSPDNGSQALAVDDPASQPYVTGVGGTALNAIGPPPSETVWNGRADGNGATGGGISNVWQMPSYQHGTGVINGFSNGHREVPDVSALADPNTGYLVYYTGTETGVTGWFPIGGTSAATPLWAGLVALANQSCGCAVGFLNPALYNLATSSFHDVTVGNNDLGNHNGTYPATVGYDMATGLGTPNATTLAANLGQAQAALTYPTPGQTNVDTTQAFTWSTVPGAQGYDLLIGTTLYGGDLVSSGVLPPSQSSFAVPALPTGKTLDATLFTEVGGTWKFSATTFTAAPGQASFTYPVNGQAGIDRAHAFTWSTIPQAQGYDLVIGTTLNGTDLVNSGVLPAGQSSFTVPALPSGKLLYATLLTKVNGAFTRYQAIVFTAAPTMAIFTNPVNGQALVDTTKPFTWTTFAGIQAYVLVVGTALYGTNLVNSGLLLAAQTSYTPPAKLPSGSVLYATLLTEIGGVWTFQAVGFTAK